MRLQGERSLARRERLVEETRTAEHLGQVAMKLGSWLSVALACRMSSIARLILGVPRHERAYEKRFGVTRLDFKNLRRKGDRLVRDALHCGDRGPRQVLPARKRRDFPHSK